MQNVFVVLDTMGYVNALIHASEAYTKKPFVAQESRVTGQYRLEDMGGQQVSRFETIEEDVEITVPPVTKLTRPRALLIVKALVDEYVSQTVRYRTPVSPVVNIAQALRDCAIPENADMLLAEDFLTNELVDTTVIELHRMLNTHIGSEVWRQWDVFDTPSMLALIGGQDYRIADWERTHGYSEDENECLTVDISTVANYIYQQLYTHIGEASRHIPLRPMLMDAIRRRYPRVVFGQDGPCTEEILLNMGVPSYEEFFQRFVDPVMKDFDLMFLRSNIKPFMPYRAELTQTFTVRFYHSELPQNEEASYFEELRQSIVRGDWIPERERRRLEEYERNN